MGSTRRRCTRSDGYRARIVLYHNCSHRLSSQLANLGRLAHRRKQFPSTELTAVVAALAASRERQGISQRELSRRLDLHPMTIMRLELGRRDLTLAEFIDFARALGEVPADLLARALENG